MFHLLAKFRLLGFQHVYNYDGLDAYQYSWLQYAFPLYLWFLIGAIILSSKHSRRVGNLLGSNPVAVLATLILMSYTKLLQTAVGVLTFAKLESSNGPGMKVWLFDGNVPYFEGKHIVLATVAICVIIFLLLPYVFLLTFGYRLQANSDRRGFRWFNKLTPLLDAYYAPYNKNTRYWTGLMLMVRISLFLSYMLSSDNLVAVSSVFSAIGIASWLSKGIYENPRLDVLEASFILNLSVLSAGTYHVKFFSGDQAVLSYLCTGVALAEFIGIVAYHMCLRAKGVGFLQNFKCIKFCLEWLFRCNGNSTEEEIAPILVSAD